MSDITIYQESKIDNTNLENSSSTDVTFIALWLRGKSEKTQRAYGADIQKFYDCVGKPLQQVTLQDVYTFVDSLLTLKPTSRNRAIAAVKSAFFLWVEVRLSQR